MGDNGDRDCKTPTNEYQRYSTDVEPLCIEDKNPFSMLESPPDRAKIVNHYKMQQNAYWKAEDISMVKDQLNIDHLLFDDKNPEHIKANEQAKKLVLYILAFFANADGIVVKNINSRLITDLKWQEISVLYTWQAMMENIHSEAYKIMLTSLVTDLSVQKKLFNAVTDIPVIRKKAEWALKYISNPNDKFLSSPDSIATRLVATACMEGLHFAASFAVLFWFKKGNKLPGLVQFNEYIQRDEFAHQETSVILYGFIKNKLSKEEFNAIVNSAVAVEIEFVREALQVELLGLNYELMTKYVMYIANRLAHQFGYPSLYNIPNTCPLEYMTMMGLDNKTNFHERPVTDYGASHGTVIVDSDGKIQLDTDF